MVRILSLAVLVSILVAALAGCGGQGASDQPTRDGGGMMGGPGRDEGGGGLGSGNIEGGGGGLGSGSRDGGQLGTGS